MSDRIPSSVSPSNSGMTFAEVAVRRGAAAGAVEQVGGDGVVAGGGEAAGDVLDVVVDAEGLLDHDHAARAPHPRVGPRRSARCRRVFPH